MWVTHCVSYVDDLAQRFSAGCRGILNLAEPGRTGALASFPSDCQTKQMTAASTAAVRGEGVKFISVCGQVGEILCVCALQNFSN